MQMPYPEVPRYTPGAYGPWDLVSMPPSRQYGYFTDARDEEGYYGLVRDARLWMTTSRMERESHAFHLSVACGRVLVCGVGMGLYLYNLCRMDRVREIVAVDIDPAVIGLLHAATDLKNWPGREKLRFICCDARQLSPGHIGSEQIDHLYVDIWPDLGSEQAMKDTRSIQAAVQARQVGYWGQEIDFGKWHVARSATRRPSALQGADYVRWCRLPLGRLPHIYLEAACMATQLCAAKVREETAMAFMHPNQRPGTLEVIRSTNPGRVGAPGNRQTDDSDRQARSP